MGDNWQLEVLGASSILDWPCVPRLGVSCAPGLLAQLSGNQRDCWRRWRNCQGDPDPPILWMPNNSANVGLQEEQEYVCWGMQGQAKGLFADTSPEAWDSTAPCH